MKTTYKNCRVRPRFQRVFLRWFQENRTRFARPIYLVGRTGKSIKMRIEGAPDILSVELYRNEFVVLVEQDNAYFDMLVDFDVAPTRVDGGYFCALTLPEYQVIYSDLPTLWRAEIYERFLQWFNDKLVSAVSIRLFRMGDGITGSELVYGDQPMDSPSRGMQILGQLKNLSGNLIFDPERDEIFMWFYPLSAEKSKDRVDPKCSNLREQS